MNKLIAVGLIMVASVGQASDITLSKGIKKSLRNKIEKDLTLLDNFKFSSEPIPETLKIMQLETLNAETASDWLNQRVHYVISEKALSFFNLLIKRVIYVERTNVTYPNAKIIPYSLDNQIQANFVEDGNANSGKSFTVMANIGSGIYSSGKADSKVYGIKISRGLFRRSEKVALTSPRAGIIQIGEGLFAPELAINPKDPNAVANSIFRLGTFFHEARHSDGNGTSLGFMHAICPKGHDYQDQPACDENLNGPYAVGALMMAEMAKGCEENCSVRDIETLKISVIDSLNRILPITHKGEESTMWDPTPESL